MSYSAANIRNICLLGHSGVGKTMLAESMLYLTGATDRLGKTADGNTVCDYDPEEIKRQITIATALAPVEFGGCKINVLETLTATSWPPCRWLTLPSSFCPQRAISPWAQSALTRRSRRGICPA